MRLHDQRGSVQKITVGRMVLRGMLAGGSIVNVYECETCDRKWVSGHKPPIAICRECNVIAKRIQEFNVPPEPLPIPDLFGDDDDTEAEAPAQCESCGARDFGARQGINHAAGCDEPDYRAVLVGYLPRSMNEREGLLMRGGKNGKPGTWVLQDEKRNAEAALREHAVDVIPQANGRIRRVRFTFVKGARSTRRDDPGNRPTRMKAPLDKMVALGMLVDDSDEWIELDPPRERKDPSGTKATIIEIWEVNE